MEREEGRGERKEEREKERFFCSLPGNLRFSQLCPTPGWDRWGFQAELQAPTFPEMDKLLRQRNARWKSARPQG